MPGPVVYRKPPRSGRQRAGRAPPLQVKGKKHRMNLDHIRYFQAIAYYEHYGRAAQALHVSQPNLNYAVTQLENELGVPLFEKHGRGVQLTRYGRLFLQSVNESLRILDAGTRDLQEMGRGGGLVLLGGIRKLAAQTVPDLMQKFLATSGNEHTRFELHTESSFTADLLQAVAEERLDMAFVSHPGDDTVFENVAFARLPFVVVAPPNHPLAQKSSVTLRETLPYPFVYFSKRGGLRRPIDALFQKIGATPKIAYETEEDTVVAGMAAAGFGIAIVPDHPVLRCMDLKIILLTAPDPGRTAYLCRKREALQPAAAQRFFAFCQAQLSQGAAL